MLVHSSDPKDRITPDEPDWVAAFLDDFLRSMATPEPEEQAVQPGPAGS